jgi:hypothetical protein
MNIFEGIGMIPEHEFKRKLLKLINDIQATLNMDYADYSLLELRYLLKFLSGIVLTYLRTEEWEEVGYKWIRYTLSEKKKEKKQKNSYKNNKKD